MLSSLLTIPEAILLGIVEGITEFLPVSSTGHLLVVGDLIGFGAGQSGDAADAYYVSIQFGAILAVLLLYRNRVASLARGLVGRDPDGRAVLGALVVSFVPAAAVGVVLGDAIKDALFGPVPVAVAWTAGGLLLLLWRPRQGVLGLHQLTTGRCLAVGAAQCVAMWPGVSRSLVVLVAGLAVGLSLAAAVEFSFLLGVVTLSAATALDLVRHGGDIVSQFGILRPALGGLVAFLTAVVAVRWMVGYLTRRSLAVFGWYRLVAAGVVVLVLASGSFT